VTFFIHNHRLVQQQKEVLLHNVTMIRIVSFWFDYTLYLKCHMEVSNQLLCLKFLLRNVKVLVW